MWEEGKKQANEEPTVPNEKELLLDYTLRDIRQLRAALKRGDYTLARECANRVQDRCRMLERHIPTRYELESTLNYLQTMPNYGVGGNLAEVKW